MVLNATASYKPEQENKTYAVLMLWKTAGASFSEEELEAAVAEGAERL